MLPALSPSSRTSLPNVGSVPRRREPLVSFKDFADDQDLTPMMRAAFQMYVQLTLGTFNFRSHSEWKQRFADFQREETIKKGRS